MHAFIYSGGGTSDRGSRIRNDFDFGSFLVTQVESENTLKIADIRALLSALAVTSPKPRLVYLPHADTLTPAAQNALLKVLEEPPEFTRFILSTPNLDSLIPTVRSRCRLIAVTPSAPAGENSQSLSILKSALATSPGTRLQIADSLGRDRLTALTYLDSLLPLLQAKIHSSSSPRQLNFLAGLTDLVLDTRRALTGNVAVSLALRNFFLTLPRVK